MEKDCNDYAYEEIIRDMKTVAIIQARCGSSRLPGKVLKDLCGKPVLAHDLERISQAKKIDQVIVATTENQGDDQVASLADSLGFVVFGEVKTMYLQDTTVPQRSHRRILF